MAVSPRCRTCPIRVIAVQLPPEALPFAVAGAWTPWHEAITPPVTAPG